MERLESRVQEILQPEMMMKMITMMTSDNDNGMVWYPLLLMELTIPKWDHFNASYMGGGRECLPCCAARCP